MRFAAAVATSLHLLAGASPAQQVSFAREVLPILSDRCFPCHGPDAQARKGNLRLDHKPSVFATRDQYVLVKPGAPEQSELIRRITATDDDLMPPRDSHLQLAPHEIATLRRWIAEGSNWTTHWSFVAPAAADLPTAAPNEWSQHAIDALVFAQLQQRGLTPNNPAAPAALLRRVCLDLTGLPPTFAQLDAFEQDPSEQHYQRIVDALLASPHYGERMAWPWLEASRYADTDGFQADPTRTAWPWRDWLVRALNDNLPFDQFTVLTLAGDLLPDATDEQRLATGFLRNNAHNGEGGRIAEETRIENGFDRTETVATVWMGLTFECARCHDHKYDPITQRDYYRLFAFFDQSSESGGGRSNGRLLPVMRYLPDAQKRARFDTITATASQLRKELQLADPAIDKEQQAWEASTAASIAIEMQAMQPCNLGPWWRSQALPPGTGGADAMFDEPFAPEHSQLIDQEHGWQRDDTLVDGKAQPLAAGTYTAYFHRTLTAATARRMRISLGSDDAIKVWCNGALVVQNNTRRGVKPDQERVELLLQEGQNELLVKIVNYGGAGGIYFQVRDEGVAHLPVETVQALLTEPSKRSDLQRGILQREFRMRHVQGFASKQAELAALETEQQDLRATGVDISVMDELPPAKRRTTHVLDRGNYQQPREAVTAGTPAFLPPLQTTGQPDRLALARWLTDGKHPLTARVAVNRAWQTFFGRGLVATSEDFGRQGDRATHPNLLDHLAHQFVANGWNVKQLHRDIVTSSTYRQAAGATAAAFAIDPNNEWLARSARHRLPAWMLRDQALALSGQLVAQIGGKPVNPYQPSGIWAEATFDTIRYQQGKGEDLYRRSLYVFWRRIVGPTVLFDTPARQACVVRRSITNTPLHALTTLNESGMVESARALATVAWQTADTTEQRITWLFRRVLSRSPSKHEAQVLHTRQQQAFEHFRSQPDAANALLSVGDRVADANIPPAQLAAMTVLASIVLNLDEALTRP